MKEKITATLSAMSSIQLTGLTRGLDEECKNILRHKEILAFILKHTVTEYEKYSCDEIMYFIEDKFSESGEVSPGKTDAVILGDDKELIALNEKTVNFDIFSAQKIRCCLRQMFLCSC